MYLLQVWFTMSDVGVEDAIYDSYAMRTFMKLNFLSEQAQMAPVAEVSESTRRT